ncbi:MAG: NfeD family protein [Gammaproteobacteria bacterium]
MAMHSARLFCLLILAWVVFFHAQAQAIENPFAQNERRTIVQLEIVDAIGPATGHYIVRNLDKAANAAAVCILIRIDTPGGLDATMREIVKKIIASPVPVVAYVAPSGARAASAGTYILYASHVAAMAPATNVGAATPVQIAAPGGLGSNGEEPGDSGQKDASKKKPEIPDNPMAHKMINDAVAYIQGLAKMRGRNAEWAEKAVREAASISSEEALVLHVIDLIATDRDDLLRKLHGRKVNVLGQEIILATQNAVVDSIEPDWRDRLLAIITNPNIAYILMMIGIYGLVMEFYNPGTVLPGTIGSICLLLALFAFQLLPVNYAGMALIILGIALMLAEAFAPGIGILGLGGVAAFVIGSVILMDTEAPGFGINPGLVGGFALSSAAIFMLAVGFLLRSRRMPVVSGKEEMLGALGEALDDFTDSGLIRIHSETWKARSSQAIRKGEKVVVQGFDGLTLIVTPFRNKETK